VQPFIGVKVKIGGRECRIQPIPNGETRTLKALIVEDNDTFREAFKKRHHNDFSFMVIEEAASGDEALQKIKERPPQLIFMDIRLPGTNGL
jgi:CheY-like chemotaxis protein